MTLFITFSPERNGGRISLYSSQKDTEILQAFITGRKSNGNDGSQSE